MVCSPATPRISRSFSEDALSQRFSTVGLRGAALPAAPEAAPEAMHLAGLGTVGRERSTKS